jgi:Spy/CpxP family protein refolding chaperone
MTKNMLGCILGAGCFFLAPSPLASQPARARSLFPPEALPSMLLSQKSVQEELKLSEDQLKKLGEIVKQRQEAREKMADVDPKERFPKMRALILETSKQARAVLKPEQDKRLLQITWQNQGGLALATPPVGKELILTEEQIKKITAIKETREKELDKIFGGEAASREDARKKSEELTQSAKTKMLEVLTQEQKQKWHSMLGEPFKGELRQQSNPRRPREP